MLSASVGDNPTVPPITGWQFYNFDTEEDEEDLSVTCHILSNSPSCILTVSLTGLAKEFQPECEGEYEDIGFKSSGRQVAESSIYDFQSKPTSTCFRCLKRSAHWTATFLWSLALWHGAYGPPWDQRTSS